MTKLLYYLQKLIEDTKHLIIKLLNYLRKLHEDEVDSELILLHYLLKLLVNIMYFKYARILYKCEHVRPQTDSGGSTQP
jgi:hypothetical protein